MTRSTLPVRCTTSSLSAASLTRTRRQQLRLMLLEQQAFRVEQLAALRTPHPARSSAAAEIEHSLEVAAGAALHDVQLALHRMAVGTYGRCVGCGTNLPIERLEILPQVALCVRCQRAVAAPAGGRL